MKNKLLLYSTLVFSLSLIQSRSVAMGLNPVKAASAHTRKSVSYKSGPQPGKSPESADLSLVYGNRVEKISLGENIKDIFKLYPANRIQRVLIYDAKGSYEKIEVLNASRSEVLFTIDPDCSENDSVCIVRRINVKSTFYHTQANLKVGKFYIDLSKSHDKIDEVNWYEGNLVARIKGTGVNYVLETTNIPKPWYDSMNQETIPDSTKIIGMMVTGKHIEGMSYEQADSIAKQKELAIAEKKLNSSTSKKVALKKARHPAVKGKVRDSVAANSGASILANGVDSGKRQHAKDVKEKDGDGEIMVEGSAESGKNTPKSPAAFQPNSQAASQPTARDAVQPGVPVSGQPSTSPVQQSAPVQPAKADSTHK